MFARVARIMAFICVFIGSWTLYAGEDVFKSDDFIQTFVEKAKNPSVKLKGGQLKLWAKMSDKERVGWIAGTLAAFIPGALFVGGSFFTEDRVLGRVLKITGIPCLILAAVIYVMWEMRSSKEGSLFLTLDDEGVCKVGQKKLLWEDVSKIPLTALDFYNAFGSKVSEIRELTFYDKYNNIVFQLNHSDLLPISVDNLAALAQHYLDCFNKAQRG